MRGLLAFSCALVCLALTPALGSSASAQTIYVAPGGSDSAPCTSREPCATFERAYELADPGATVLVGAGTYPDQTITGAPKGGDARIVFKPAPGAAVNVAGEL